MKLIFAQGNPGSQYKFTRHNVGFLALDSIAENANASFQEKAKFKASVAEINRDGEKIILAKPTTFYNETGASARSIADFYKIEPQNILVIHDELALPFGTLRTREKGSDAGNNGIKSLNAHLGAHFARLRIGIWNDLANRIDSAGFVLSRFSERETTLLSDKLLPEIATIVEKFMRGNHDNTSVTITLDEHSHDQ